MFLPSPPHPLSFSSLPFFSSLIHLLLLVPSSSHPLSLCSCLFLLICLPSLLLLVPFLLPPASSVFPSSLLLSSFSFLLFPLLLPPPMFLIPPSVKYWLSNSYKAHYYHCYRGNYHLTVKNEEIYFLRHKKHKIFLKNTIMTIPCVDVGPGQILLLFFSSWCKPTFCIWLVSFFL